MTQIDLPNSSLPTISTKPIPVASRWAGQRYGWLARLAGYLGMMFCVLVIGLPVYWMVIGAFKDNAEIYRIPPTWLPLEPTLSNFGEAWTSAPFGRYYINTLLTTLFGSGFEVFFAVTSAYAFVFLRFPKKEWLFLVLLATLMVPSQVTILPII
jgi:sn-glycerol 3-phosphate transport system permease protein